MKIALSAVISSILLFSCQSYAQDVPSVRNIEILRTIDVKLDQDRIAFSSNKDALQKLFLLLRLKAQPTLVDDQRRTHEFMALFPPSEMARFRPLADQRGVWKGADEFQQEDTRKAFLASYKSKILSMVPELPLQLVIEKDIPTRTYDPIRGGFDLKEMYGDDYGVNNLWGSASTASGMPGAYHPQFGEIVVASPIRFPNFLKATEQDARAIREFERANEKPSESLRARLSFLITDVRPFFEQQKYMADTRFVSLEVAMGKPLRETVTLLAPTYVASESYSGSMTSNPAYLNADLTRILALKASQDLSSQDTFVRDSFFIRTVTERKMRTEGLASPDASNWRPAMPSGFLEAVGTQFGPRDIEAYRKWMKERALEVGDVVRVRGLRAHNGKIELAKIFDQWQLGKLNPVSERTLADVRQKYPESIGLAQIPSWDDMSVLVSMTENEHWMSAKSGLGGNPNIFVDFKIAPGEILSAQGKPLLILRMEPIAFGTEEVNGPQAQALKASATVSGYSYDILGVKLGQDVDEAKEKILASFSDYQTGVKVNAFNDDPVMPQWTQIDAGKDGVVHERILIASLAGSRKIVFIKRARGPGMPTTDGVEIGKLIDRKYGPSKRLNQISTGRSPNPVTMSRLENSTGCWSKVGFPYDHDSNRCFQATALRG